MRFSVEQFEGCGTVAAMATEPDDFELVERIRRGESAAFEPLVRRYERYVFAIVHRHVPAQAVEEVAHDVFIRAYQSLDSFQQRSPFKFWLATIAVRRCCEFWRTRRFREVSVSELTAEGREWCATALDKAAIDGFTNETNVKAAQEVLAWALQDLAPEDRTLITLLHLEERSVKEIAALLGWSAAKVKVRAFRARQQLRRKIDSLD